MKFYCKLIDWIRKQYENVTTPKYKNIPVNDYPKEVKENTVYIVSDGPIPDTLIFKCPCGCQSIIYLNLLSDTKPQWHFAITNNRDITVSPSIWRKVGCKSHFFIRNGKVRWC